MPKKGVSNNPNGAKPDVLKRAQAASAKNRADAGEITRADLLKGMRKSKGVISEACKIAGCSRNTYHYHYTHYPKFAEEIKEIMEEQVDFVESNLLKQIKAGETSSTIFYLKTKGKHRGYVETIETVNTHKIDAAFSDVDMATVGELLIKCSGNGGKRD